MERRCLVNMSSGIFIAAPISGFDDKNEYKKYKTMIINLARDLRNNGFSVCTELEKTSGLGAYDAPDKSVDEDFQSICANDLFLMIHPRKMQTSSLIELGYALGQRKKIIIVANKEELPFLAKGLIDGGYALACDIGDLHETDLIIYKCKNLLSRTFPMNGTIQSTI